MALIFGENGYNSVNLPKIGLFAQSQQIQKNEQIYWPS